MLIRHKGVVAALVIFAMTIAATAQGSDSNVSLTKTSLTRSFNMDSYSQIVGAIQQQPMLLVLWSLDCPPCRGEMPDMAEFAEAHPGIKVILVSVDGLELADEVESILASNELQQLESWIFADTYIEKLRFSIDPNWRGELPRSYLYIPGEKRQRIRGRIDFSRLSEYLAQLKISNG